MYKIGEIGKTEYIKGAGVVKPLNSGFLINKSNGINRDLFVHARPSQNNSKTDVPLYKICAPQLLLKTYSDENYVAALIEKNPKLQNLMQSMGLNKIYPNNVLGISNTHLMTTTAYAMRIANEMGINSADKKLLEQACVFHDYGKILIPDKIVNKPTELTKEEKAVMDMHAELGWQLLSNTNMNKRVLNLIRNHHKSCAENADILGQILSVADIYSALREQRSYKVPFTEEQAFNILDQKARQGEVSTEVVKALKKSLILAKSA